MSLSFCLDECSSCELLSKSIDVVSNSRGGAIDWDYHTQVRPYASIIHPIQFREWRLNGKAFEFGGTTYDSENRSLVDPDHSTSFARTMRTDNLNMDVVTGPFVSHGITCDRSNSFADGLFEVHHLGTGVEQHRYSATDVALYNITSFMWQYRRGKEYQMKFKGDVLSGLGAEDQSDLPPHCEDENSDKSDKMKISLVPVRDARRIFNKKFKQYFDTIFVSRGASSILQDSNLYDLLKGDATMVVETCRFDVSKSASYKQESIENIREILSNANAVETNDTPNTLGDTLLTFKFHSNN